MVAMEPSIARDADVSVLIVSYRTPDLTVAAVRSALAEPAVRDVVVVDNDSGDDTPERLADLGDPRVIVVASPSNDGFGTAANRAARRASGDTLVFLNSDAVLRSGACVTLVDVVAASGGRAIAGPRLVGSDGTIQRSAGLVPRPADLLVRGLGLHRVGSALSRIPVVGRLVKRTSMAAEYELATTATEPTAVSMVSGACLAIGRAAFVDIGGFDERYFMYFEDADLCRRATLVGWPVVYVPDSVVDHVGGASSSDDYRFGERHAASMVRYLRTWHGSSGVLIGLMILWLRLVGRAVTLRPWTGRALASLRAGLSVAVRER